MPIRFSMDSVYKWRMAYKAGGVEGCLQIENASLKVGVKEKKVTSTAPLLRKTPQNYKYEVLDLRKHISCYIFT